MTPAPTDCPVCDRPTFRDGECASCGFSTPTGRRAVGLAGVQQARAELEAKKPRTEEGKP